VSGPGPGEGPPAAGAGVALDEQLLATAEDRALARQLGTLVLSGVVPQAGGGALAAAAWWNGLLRLGVSPPLFVVHDLGLVLAREPERRRVEELAGAPVGGGRQVSPLVARYRALLAAVASSESVRALGGTFLRDEVVAVLLARLLGDAWRRWAPRPAGGMDWGLRGAGGAAEAPSSGLPTAPLPLASPLYTIAPATLARRFDPAWAEAFLQPLLDRELALRARLDQLDLGPLRLLGLFPPGTVPPDLVDLQQLLGRAGIGDVVDFCLQLLPSLLETKRHGAPQRFAVDGYASVERRGAPGALLPSELAHDEEVFALRALSDELLYYGHERPQDGGRRVHGVLVDASASMRGAREVFARGLALALAKKLALTGVDVWLRFFDSRLHRKVPAGTLAGQDLPYLLCFRSERGRNYARVFQDLLVELEQEAGRTRREVSLTIVTHASCQIPRATVEALARRAALHAVFVLPSQPLALDYLPLLHQHQVVTAEALAAPSETKRRALEIVGAVVRDR
jgi:hypothetical protein